MNVTLPEKIKFKKRQIVIYTASIVFCIISIIIAFYVQFYARIDFWVLLGISSNEYDKKTTEQVEVLKIDFDKLFNNSVANVSEQNNDKRQDRENPIIYTKLEKKESKLNNYDVDIHVPYINIDNENIDKYNKEIEEVFVSKAESVLGSKNKNIIYTIKNE